MDPDGNLYRILNRTQQILIDSMSTVKDIQKPEILEIVCVFERAKREFEEEKKKKEKDAEDGLLTAAGEREYTEEQKKAIDRCPVGCCD